MRASIRNEPAECMPEVTILPDGVRVDGCATDETLLRALAGPGCVPRRLQARRLRDLQGPARARRGPLRATDRRERAQRRRAGRGHLPELPGRADHQHRHRTPGRRPAADGFWDSPTRTRRSLRAGREPAQQRRRKGKESRMGKTSAVIRLGYVHLRVTDLEEARNHYSNTLGMEVVHEEPGKLWLKCWDEWDHHSLVLEEGGVGLVKFGYKVENDDDLADFETPRPAVRRHHRPVQRGGEPQGRRRGAAHPALRAHHRALHRHGVHRHRDRVDQPRGLAAERARGRHALDRPRPDPRRGPGADGAVHEGGASTSSPPSGWSRAWSTPR